MLSPLTPWSSFHTKVMRDVWSAAGFSRQIAELFESVGLTPCASTLCTSEGK